MLDPYDVRSKVFEKETMRIDLALKEKKANSYLNGNGNGRAIGNGTGEENDGGESSTTIMLYVAGIIGSIILLSLGTVWLLLRLYPD